MDNIFCEIFVREILKIDKTQFNLSSYIVLPNERVKSEYKKIDVLIINKKSKQAIIELSLRTDCNRGSAEISEAKSAQAGDGK